MVSKYHQKTKKSFKNKHAKGTKIFLMKKKTKSPNMLKKDIKILLKKKKKKRCHYYQEREQKLPEYRRNYYLAHKM